MLAKGYKRKMIVLLVFGFLLNILPEIQTVKAETTVPEEVTVTKVGGGVAIGSDGWVLYDGESAFGMFTLPSAFRLFSRNAISIRGGATTVLFSV